MIIRVESTASLQRRISVVLDPFDIYGVLYLIEIFRKEGQIRLRLCLLYRGLPVVRLVVEAHAVGTVLVKLQRGKADPAYAQRIAHAAAVDDLPAVHGAQQLTVDVRIGENIVLYAVC